MNVGVVGCGYWGSKHVRVLQGLSEVDQVAAIDPREEIRASLQAAFPGLAAFPSLEAAAGSVDAVVLATPPATHAELGLEAMDAGLHVLIEKPLATTPEDARRLIEEAERRHLTLMVGHTFEYNPAVWQLRDLIRSGELGRVLYIDSARLNLGLYQSDVNVLWDLAPHDVSIMNFLLDAKPTVVDAWGSRHVHDSLEDVAYLRLEYSDLDVTTQIHVSWLDPAKVRRVTVVGDEKMAVYNDLNQEERIRIYDKGVDPLPSEAGPDVPLGYRYGGITSPVVDFREPLQLEDQHFVRSILDGRTPATDGESGLSVVETLFAADHAMQSGRSVQLDLAPTPAVSAAR
ncbi:MAG: Gfo/Idh/MocA family protein [Nitriliruptoraceae bacterium]